MPSDDDLAAALLRLPPVERPVVTKILESCATRYGVSVAAIRGPNRHGQTLSARHAAIWLLRKELGLSWPVIGNLVHKDHSTAISAVKRIETGKADHALVEFVGTMAVEFRLFRRAAAPSPALEEADGLMPPLAGDDLAARVRHDFSKFPTGGTTYDRLRANYMNLALELVELCPESRDLSLALTALEESLHWAAAAVAKNLAV